jgi:prepilin-type N-terminal cleavage/methylation domain-containing protein
MSPMVSRARAFTLIEVLIATLVLAGLGLSIYEMAISSTRGVATDRLSEVQRGLVQDLLERFCQPNTDIASMFPEQPKNFRSRTFTVDEALAIVHVEPEEAPTLKAILTAGKVEGFTLVWQPRIGQGKGSAADALRLDSLSVAPVLVGDSPGPRIESFRVFAVRGDQGE